MTSYPGGQCDFPGCFFHGIYVYTLPSAFVAKFDPLAFGAASLIYSTFLGGSPGTVANGIAVDPLGNAYITGSTGDIYGPPIQYVPFPTSTGAFQTGPDANDAFVTKLNAAGNNLIYSTLLGCGSHQGGQNSDGLNVGTAIELDGTNDAYLTGLIYDCSEANFPTTADAYQQNDPNYLQEQAFVTKFNSTGTGLIYSSYLGATAGSTTGYGIAVDQVGDAYLTGNIEAFDFPVTSFAFQGLYAGQGDAFVTKFPDRCPGRDIHHGHRTERWRK